MQLNIFIHSIYSGLVAIIIDVIIRQLIIQNMVEKEHIPKECIKYRRTSMHFFSIFLVGFIMYFIFTIFHLHY